MAGLRGEGVGLQMRQGRGTVKSWGVMRVRMVHEW